jgi:predicted small secreted protein
MVKLFQSVVAALLVASALALAGCADDTTSGATPGVFGTSGTTVGTGTTPGGQAVLVRLGTDNLIGENPPKYEKLWVALVTDVNGNALPGITVTFALRSGTPLNPGGYMKGFFVLPPPAPAPQVWNQAVTAVCANEDANFNGILDAGEDLNGNGLLTPFGAAAVNPTGVSDSLGFADAVIAYAKDYAFWTTVTLEARVGVSGTPATATFDLVGLASDYSNLGVAPPGQPSPFGTSGNCADTL